MKIRYQDGEWWKFTDEGEGVNQVKIIDIDDRPLTDETLEELGFVKGGDKAFYLTINAMELIKRFDEDFVETASLRPRSKWKTVGSVKMLIEVLKGDG